MFFKIPAVVCEIGLILFFFISRVVYPYQFPTEPWDYLAFDGKALTLQSISKEIKKSWKADSGRPFTSPKHQSIKNWGPLPEGRYVVQINRTLRFSTATSWKEKVKWILRSPGWGLIATPLEPDFKTPNGRNGFLIHGGGWILGSRGCIYLKSLNDDFHRVMTHYERNVWLVVEYE